MNVSRTRSRLDAIEARLLRDAEAVQIWTHFGMVSPLDYLERKLGYTPHAANERLRVAKALGALPAIEAALADGRLCFSAVRELTRIADAGTEADWIAWADGKSVREIEEMVAAHDEGDLPHDLPKPIEARNHRVWLELPPETYARWRQAMAVLSDEKGRRLEPAAFVEALIDAALDGTIDSKTSDVHYQIAVTMCPSCKLATQEGGGIEVPIDAAALERASCDAVHIGSLDGDPERATRTIPPSVRRFVMHRDHRRCRVPGCRSAKHLDLHHIVHREDGGQHEPELLIAMCGSCHAAHHRGDLRISGTSHALVVERPNDPDRSHVGPRKALRQCARAR